MEIFDAGMINKFMKKDSVTKMYCSDAESCGEPTGRFPEEMPLAMCYVPMQKWDKIYDPVTGLQRGTIFAELDKPFIGEEAVRSGR
ncbi:MAG: spore coat associated protein CotJA [Clostridiales bacterium]|nr:spore coat associated protein CotJA [Clostridiales bacterium]